MPRRFIGPDRPNAEAWSRKFASSAPFARIARLARAGGPGPRPPGPRTGFGPLSPATSDRRRIASAATLILVAYGLSRVLGAVRELVIANTFGTSHNLDNYRVAFGVPDLLFNLLLAGAISALDKAAEKGVLHANNASRRKARLMSALAKLAPVAETSQKGTAKSKATPAPPKPAKTGKTRS